MADRVVRSATVGLESLAPKAIDILYAFLTSEYDRELHQRAKIAIGVVGAWQRHRATQAGREAGVYMMARELADGKEQLAAMLRQASPNAPIVKALPEAKEAS